MGITINQNTKGLIFDLDGTLSDSLPVHVATWNKVGEEYGFDFDPQIVYEMTGRPTIEFARRVVSQFNLAVSPEEIVGLKQQAFWESTDLLKPVDQVVALVKKYFGKLPLAVGTGASRKSAEIQLEILNLRHYFDAIVSADDVAKHKPDPDTFLKCAQLIGVEPQFCQVFEDGDLGIAAAEKAGMMVTDVRPFINYGEWILS
ncbi:MAG: beta-phosphoglucomutase family hydrolase [Prolixibacteraceae bacterium]|jgi:beta-phosphoglucomutase family hydrolase|nr:beta-phosphoglucomutase family hydrolase [Prolixibacteraceae bacterium]MBT6005187.1 beta-phosphoglucomutase family hydrolase [Prolixibacteraceae bacterium]MBT7000875.1 beta-phosphoglucomutase family hydrolase [Prolixibacteraceae bacterium]MBT7394753.1 beta-phosphoglucomutase family hydrolase [Prolixibacteraceae bacterium]